MTEFLKLSSFVKTTFIFPGAFYASANGKASEIAVKIASSTRRRSGSHVCHSRRAVAKTPANQRDERDYVFDRQFKNNRLTDAFLGALPSRRRVEKEMLRCKTRRRDAGAPRSLCNSPPEKIA
jgi:hypothetical protein